MLNAIPLSCLLGQIGSNTKKGSLHFVHSAFCAHASSCLLVSDRSGSNTTMDPFFVFESAPRGAHKSEFPSMQSRCTQVPFTLFDRRDVGWLQTQRMTPSPCLSVSAEDWGQMQRMGPFAPFAGQLQIRLNHNEWISLSCLQVGGRSGSKSMNGSKPNSLSPCLTVETPVWISNATNGFLHCVCQSTADRDRIQQIGPFIPFACQLLK